MRAPAQETVSRSYHFFGSELRLYCRGGVQQHLLENREILDVAPATQSRDAARRVRPVVLQAFRNRDQLGRFKPLQMPIEVAVGERAQLFEIAEQQAFRMSDERGEHAQAGALVNDAIQAVVRESGPGAFLGGALIQEVPRSRTEARPRPATVRRQTGCPSSWVIGPVWCCRRPGRIVPSPGTKRRPRTFAAARSGRRQILPDRRSIPTIPAAASLLVARRSASRR